MTADDGDATEDLLGVYFILVLSSAELCPAVFSNAGQGLHTKVSFTSDFVL